MNRIFLLLSTILCTVYCANSVADVQVKLGEDATFICDFDHTESYVISWFVINRDGEPTKLLKYTSDTDEATKINKDVHDKREFVASGDTFTIKATQKEDNINFAKVQCEVESGTNSDIDAGSLTVIYDGTVSGIMEKRGIFDVSDQKVLVATCVATNYYPKPSIKFLINGKEPVKEEKDADLFTEFLTDLTTTLDNDDGSVTFSDQFSIKIDASLDNSQISCQVLADGFETQEHQFGLMRVNHEVSQVFIDDVEEAYTEGDVATVKCRSNGYPKPMITNFGVDGGVGADSELSFTVTSDMNGKSLSCSAKLEVGQETPVSATKSLVVNYNKDVVVSGADAVEVLSDINLSCTSAANPAATYSWKKGDEDVGEGETLTISEAKFGDAGDYVCVSKSLNEVSSAPVSVSVSGMVLSSMNQNASTADADEKGVTMVCSAQASEAPTFVWTHAGAVKEGAEAASDGLTHTSTLTLTPEQATPELSLAMFTCTATLGEKSESADFTLEVIEEKSSSAGIVIGILVVILLIAVIIGFMYYKGMICKSEGKGGDETADDINVEMRNDADVEAGEAEKEKLVEEPAAE